MRERLRSAVWGEGIGEIDLSEDVEDTGDVVPPQPKKVWSLVPPGDLGAAFWMVEFESFESLDKVRDIALGEVVRCGGVGLDENMDIVEREWLVELESLYQGPTESEADVRPDSLVNLACFAKAALGEDV